jgi:hypothetical protein
MEMDTLLVYIWIYRRVASNAWLDGMLEPCVMKRQGKRNPQRSLATYWLGNRRGLEDEKKTCRSEQSKDMCKIVPIIVGPRESSLEKKRGVII